MRSFLLASVSSAALATTAWADGASKPKHAPPPAPLPPTWAGFYAGVDLGWLGNKASTQELAQGYGSLQTSMNVSGAIGGGHVGYNWQTQQIVFGVEADIGGGSGSRTVTYPPGTINPDTFSSSINWLSTFRGRLGIAVDQWLFYGTGGLAVAAVHNVRNDFSGPFVLDQTKTMSGAVWGGGVERMFGPNWSARVEALAMNFGNSTVTTNAPNGTYITRFTNKATVVRGGVSYKW